MGKVLKMNRKNIFGSGVSAVAILLAVAGCSTPTITTEYLNPPEKISNIKNIETMEIVVNVSTPGNNAEDISIARGVICERLAAAFAANKFYRTTDFVWGNPQGAWELHKLMQDKKSRHGYARLMTDRLQPRARMILDFDVKVQYGVENLDVQTSLQKVFYVTRYREEVIYWGHGEHKNRERIRIPYSVPARTIRSIAHSDVKKYWAVASGSLDVAIIDKNGKLVYKRKFDNLKASAECDHIDRNALPTKASLFSQMSKKLIPVIIKDCSPHYVTKTLKINEDGDERGFELLQALAYSEAFDVYQSIAEEERTFADWENLGIIFEVSGDYEAAGECYETAIKVKKADKGWFDYDKNIAEDGLVRIRELIAASKKFDKLK